MLEYTYSFWQVLGMLFVMYHATTLITEVRLAIRAKEAAKEAAKIIKIDITKTDDTWYAFEAESKKFLAQSATYEDLQLKLSKVNDTVTYIVEEAALKKLISESNDAGII